MALEIKKPVVRRTRDAYNVLYCSGSKARRVVVSILPGDVLEFREEGRRERFLLSVQTAFRHAVHAKALKDALEKHKAKCAKKGLPHTTPAHKITRARRRY